VRLGRIPREEFLRLHSRAWALLFPSINEEPLPYAVVEAAAVGTIPVAFRVGGVPEVVEGTPAENFLCKSLSRECLQENLDSVLALSLDKLLTISVKLQEETRQRFNLNNIERKIVKLFE